jgi:hypothetical protein
MGYCNMHVHTRVAIKRFRNGSTQSDLKQIDIQNGGPSTKDQRSTHAQSSYVELHPQLQSTICALYFFALHLIKFSASSLAHKAARPSATWYNALPHPPHSLREAGHLTVLDNIQLHP